MGKKRHIIHSTLLLAAMLCPWFCIAQVHLTDSGKSAYKIIIPAKPTPVESHAATVLQKYLKEISGAQLPIVNDKTPIGKKEIRIGKTSRPGAVPYNKLSADGLFIRLNGNYLTLTGGKSKGVLYSVYSFLEDELGCRKYTPNLSLIPKTAIISLPASINVIENPTLNFREVYYPEAGDQEYLDWHKLNRRDESWGLWVHTFDKLVPSKEYYKPHPEYYALVDGLRQPTQLCLSNPEVLQILSANLRKRIAADPEKKYWSVSQNDGLGYCECDKCRAIDEREGGPQGSIVNFVNKVAAKFPDKVISTLAYTYSHAAPRTLKPAPNVHIMFSSIDCNRGMPIETDLRSAGFRKDLRNWSLLTKNLFVWDYVVQFTNYQSPFPNLHTLQPNAQFFIKNGAKGLFEQGSGDTEGEFSELKSYLLAKLSWNTNINIAKTTDEFMQAFYGKAAPFIMQYINLLHNSAEASGRVVDIYGSPVKEYNSYLTPELIERYGKLFDQAEAAVDGQPAFLSRVSTVRLPVEYAVLQQTKFYGIEKHGAFVKNDDGDWVARPGLLKRVARFTEACKQAGISTLSEEPLSPDQYLQHWKNVIKAGPKIHAALGAEVTALNLFSAEYPNKGARTLTDGSRGYNDFQYNWLGWYGNDMAVVVDLGKETDIKQISLSFLEDQRHWAFVPETISVALSADGKSYTEAGLLKNLPATEDYAVSVIDNTLNLSQSATARYIRITATNLKILPKWRAFKNRKAWIFADEVTVK